MSSNFCQFQLPNGSSVGAQLSQDKKKGILTNFNVIRSLFVKLKIIYDKVNNDCSGMDYTPIEVCFMLMNIILN